MAEKYGFEFKDIFYCSENSAPTDKLIGFRKYSVDLMIDDKPEVALHLVDNGIEVLLFDTKYNQNVNHSNIVRVYDWNDVYEKIAKIERK